ncbi:MAG: hypothetical protein NW205_09055, partial [Hyphomicrobiaceae bacterium]|nr:hypothetical protein [Hyphomicrobiaceae bacterium]
MFELGVYARQDQSWNSWKLAAAWLRSDERAGDFAAGVTLATRTDRLLALQSEIACAQSLDAEDEDLEVGAAVAVGV